MVNKINELWEIDTIGPIKQKDGHGSKFILTAIDMFSRRAETQIINKKGAESVCDFVEKLIKKFGKPESILSDNGLEFANLELKNLCFENKIIYKN